MDYATYREPITQDPSEEKSSGSFFKFDGHLDLVLMMTMVTILVFGFIVLWSASYDYSLIWLENPYKQIGNQAIFLSLGLFVMISLSFVNYHQFHRFSVPIIGFTILLLIAVFIFGKSSDDTPTRTLLNGSVQPSELAKIATIIYLSVWLNSKREDTGHITLGLVPYGVITAVITFLIWKQPDNSAALTVAMMAAVLFILGGKNIFQFLAVLVVFMLIGISLILLFSSTGQDRINDFIAGLQDPLMSSDHVIYVFEAVVNGGFFGVGLGNSAIKYTVLPFASTDSIFAVIIEELGLIGATFTVGLFGLLTWRGFSIAKKAPDMLGALIAGGLTIWIAFEATVNMLSILGWIPFAGNTLPFFSYGGSNLLVTMSAVGILFNISRFSNHNSSEKTWSEKIENFGVRGRNRRRSVSGDGRSGEFDE